MDKMQDGAKKYREKVLKGEIVVKKRPSMSKAIRAKCKDCMNSFRDGRLDCEIEKCSLYYWMPYGVLKKQRKLDALQRRPERSKKEEKCIR